MLLESGGDKLFFELCRSFGYAQIDFKILVDQSMPLGADKDRLDSSSDEVQDSLTPDERIALACAMLGMMPTQAIYSSP